MILCKKLGSVEENMIVSSVNARWFKWSVHLGMPNPLNIVSSNNLFNDLDSTSTDNTNKVGDSGLPYFNPLVDFNKPELCPFTNIEYQLLDSKFQTILIKCLTNPILLKTCNKYFHNTLSYAFAMFNLITTLAGLPLNLKSVTISWVRSILSNILLPFTNPDWLCEIGVGRRFSSLSWITLDNTLLMKLLKHIGLKSEKV